MRTFTYASILFLSATVFFIACKKEQASTTLDNVINSKPLDLAKAKNDVQNALLEISKVQQGTSVNLQTRASGQFIVVPAGSVDAINQALTDAGGNGVVYLRSGMHAENTNLVIKSTAIIAGEDGAILKIKSAPSIPGTDGLIPLNPAIHILNAPSSAVINVSIQPLDGDGSTGILFENSAQSASMRNNFTGFQFSVVVEKSDNPVIMLNKIVGSTLSSRGGITTELGILNMNGKSSWIAQNEVSGNTHGIFVCDKYGTATQNYVHNNFTGLTLCAFGGVKLPSGQSTGGLSSAINWKITGNRSENNTSDGFLVIHGANDNILQNNSTTGNGGADFDLTGKTSRFGFPANASFNNNVIASSSQKVQDCGNNNKISGGTLSSTPCIDFYPNDVAVKWMRLQMELIKTTTGYTPSISTRSLGYTGLAMYESIVPTVSNYQSVAIGFGAPNPAPSYDPTSNYYSPASANAAMAAILRNLFVTTSTANKAIIDSLENDFVSKFQSQSNTADLNRSIALGKEVANNIYLWSKTDGGDAAYLNLPSGYVPPVGPGLWVTTPPAFAPAALPYWGNNRSFIKGIATAVFVGPPPAYSEDPNSDFYKMVNNVYTVSQNLLPDDSVVVKFWGDIPGRYNAPSHFTSIVNQIVTKEQLSLFDAVMLYAKHGIALYDASITVFKTKYVYNLVRPITYIRTVMNHPNWNTVITTPAFPEYTSSHAVAAKSSATVLEDKFGKNYSFTDNTYATIYGPRTYTTLSQYAVEGAQSRVLGGLHFQLSADIGLAQGQKVGDMVNAIKFKK